MVKKVHDPWTNLMNQLVGSDLFSFVKMSIPATTYAIQNNLLFIALHHLDSAIYQVCYQLKTFTAAVFAIIMLHKSYTKLQWFSFLLLALGAIFANLSIVDSDNASHSSSPNSKSAPANDPQKLHLQMNKAKQINQNKIKFYLFIDLFVYFFFIFFFFCTHIAYVHMHIM
ncbi:hypothetical protein RFI_01298 [Reticulomyxa filosa]|uniref:UDP-galactose transporter n=1 Tax=Reticulomyxa filosa TaxID=46433 RepID=X6PCG6_RETFI|nr:hypothetical protein RFI_01298 [Reticulomyxa filosa]|eukprot:ETO35764.1 hypothetical protein RFI_01298 [Reticulomyxa filosa]